MTGEVNDAQEYFFEMTKKETGFIRPHPCKYYLNGMIDWV